MLKRVKKGIKNFFYVKMIYKIRGKWYIIFKLKEREEKGEYFGLNMI